jgi:hypothetical protein
MCSTKRVPELIVPAFGFPEEAVATAAATTAAAVTMEAATTEGAAAASTGAAAAASTGAAEVAATDSKSSPLLEAAGAATRWRGFRETMAAEAASGWDRLSVFRVARGRPYHVACKAGFLTTS